MTEYTFATDSLIHEIVDTKKGKEYYVEGYISTPDLDQGNDIVTDSCLDDMVDQLKSGNIKIDVEHETWSDSDKLRLQIGRIIGVKRDSIGIKVRVLLNKDHRSFKETWGSIKNKFIDAFSIAYAVKNYAEKIIKGEKVRLLNQIILRNVALTGNPMNTMAKITETFMKSVTNIRDIEEKKVVKQGNEYCVIKHDTGETLKCFDTKEEADNMLQAIMANKSLDEFVEKFMVKGGNIMTENKAKVIVETDKTEDKDVTIKTENDFESVTTEIKSLNDRIAKLEVKEDVPEEKPKETPKEEPKEEAPKEEAEIKELKSRIELLEKALKEPQFKAKSEQAQIKTGKETVNPLSQIYQEEII